MLLDKVEDSKKYCFKGSRLSLISTVLWQSMNVHWRIIEHMSRDPYSGIDFLVKGVFWFTTTSEEK